MPTSELRRKNPAPGIDDQFFGKSVELGKTDARHTFLHLIDEISATDTTCSITDHGKKVAIIMGYKQYRLLVEFLQKHAGKAGKNPLAGLIEKVDDLEKANAEMIGIFEKAVEKSAESI